jgi:hypothetical protein
MPGRSIDLVGDLIVGLSTQGAAAAQRAVTTEAKRRKLVERWAADPWAYLTAKDLDGRPLIWTKDGADPETPVKPFPEWATTYPWQKKTLGDRVKLEYLQEYVNVLFTELRRAAAEKTCAVVLIDKARQMIVTTATLLFADWRCRLHVGRSWLLSKRTEDEGKALLRDLVRFPYTQMPEWFREAYPSTAKPEVRVAYPQAHSEILAVGENVASSESRGGTKEGFIVDEAARQVEFGSIIAAGRPMASIIVAPTTAEIGNAGAWAFRQLMAGEA